MEPTPTTDQSLSDDIRSFRAMVNRCTRQFARPGGVELAMRDELAMLATEFNAIAMEAEAIANLMCAYLGGIRQDDIPDPCDLDGGEIWD